VSNLFELLKQYRDPVLARRLIDRIRALAKRLEERVLIMHVCGTHEWTITHYGIRYVLPENIEVRAGPGCPVCILPAQDIDTVIDLALEERLSVIAYGDVSRARGTMGLSLEDARSLGLDLRIVYSLQDAITIAKRESNKRFLFFGVGFDTTCPSTAYMVLKGPPSNMMFYSCYRYVPPSVGWLLELKDLEIEGFITPGHSGTVTGMEPYKKYFDRNPKPMVFSGFEPIDVLISILMILRQIVKREYKIENEYTRSVRWEGNTIAMSTALRVFKLEEGLWRGIGVIEGSAFEFKEEFSSIDARRIYGLEKPLKEDYMPSGCRCADIIIGKTVPTECPLYMQACTPQRPIGPCMVSVEGTCRIWAEHRVLSQLLRH